MLKLPLAILSLIYGTGVWVRNKCFDFGLLKSEHFPVPVIGTGNLSVGGTGKTPHTEYLIRLLQRSGLNVAVLSRGYKRKSRGYLLATPETDVAQIGDEPFQMKQKFPQIRVAVDANRRRGIRQLMAQNNPPVDVILLDDAFQHRYVHPGLNILLTDSTHPFFHDRLMPLGRLREPPSSARRADIVIFTKCPDMDDDSNLRAPFARPFTFSPGQQVYFSAIRYEELIPLFGGEPRRLQSITPDTSILLLTGIAHPTPLKKKLEAYTPHVDLFAYPDHYAFTGNDLRYIRQQFRHTWIVTTEKDAARLKNHPALDHSLRQYLYVLPINIVFLHHQQKYFNQIIMKYVTDHSRNSDLFEK
ncbi:MAG: tetraacyldisaccharide 4'-kinase [Prevotellaceae bacterium]|nr:tetraacyldisaccharide 4'-kinase [Prevotellaceae bacterium]